MSVNWEADARQRRAASFWRRCNSFSPAERSRSACVWRGGWLYGVAPHAALGCGPSTGRALTLAAT